MAPRVAVIVPSAGVGARFGRDRRKPFYTLLGKPLLAWSLGIFDSIPGVSEIIPVVQQEELHSAAAVADEYGLKKIRRIVPGGKERQDSVYNGLKAAAGADIVIVHDAARPLVNRDTVERSLAALTGFDGVITAVPVKDTIKEIELLENAAGVTVLVRGTIPRERLMAVQTPQVFSFPVLLEAHEQARAEGFYGTDDASLVERRGGRIRVVPGSYSNIKITTPEDIFVAEALLKALEPACG